MPETAEHNYTERSALYYPYIHIRSENWLKSALLAFQKVSRMSPYANTLTDEDIVQPYIELKGLDGSSLLDIADIHTEGILQAQQFLFSTFSQHEAAIVAKYRKEAVPAEFCQGEKAFQLHRGKLLDDSFAQWLIDNNLAWNTRANEEQDAFNWLTMHPRLGSAIMSVLGLVVAREKGLKVVTPSRQAHQTLLANTEEQVLSKFLEVPGFHRPADGAGVTVQELSQVVLMTGFDLTNLKPEDIRDMVVKGGKELRKFYGKLSSFSANIAPDLDAPSREKALRLKAEEVLADWRECTEKLPQLKEATVEGLKDKGFEKAIDAAKDASLITFIAGWPGIALAVATSVGTNMLRKKETPWSFLNRVEKSMEKSIGSLYIPQWRNLAS